MAATEREKFQRNTFLLGVAIVGTGAAVGAAQAKEEGASPVGGAVAGGAVAVATPVVLFGIIAGLEALDEYFYRRRQ